MKLAHRLLIVILVLILCLPAAACFTKDTDYLEKDLLTLADMERLFKNEGFKLAKAGKDKLMQFTQRQKSAAAYIVEGDPDHILIIYVFESAEQRERAMEDYSVFTSTASMLYHRILGAKNILVILFAGFPASEYYEKMATAMERARTS